MSSAKVKVKWSNGKTTLEDIELNSAEPPALFKAQLMTLTGVPVERQKLMFKGSVIKDDTWPDKFQSTNGMMFMLMGSSEKVPEAPVEKPKFVEDMDEDELAVALDVPSGLTNLGNTCYANATVQCLKTVPELREALRRFDFLEHIKEGFQTSYPHKQSLVNTLRLLYENMDKSSLVEPIIFVSLLHKSIPRFAQAGEGETFQQQDANECWVELTRILQQYLKPLGEKSKHASFVDQYFGGVLESEMKCDEAPDEPATKSDETFLQLSCFISQEVKYMQSGLTSRMKETITKLSPTLDRDALYTKTSKISRLPAYLTIQFVRFHYKGDVQTNAKLLREVKFGMVLDVYDLCTKELQDKLAPMRRKYQRADDLLALSKSKNKTAPTSEPAPQPAVDEPGAGSSAGEMKSNRIKFHSNDPNEMKKYTFEDDDGSNNSGFYELKAVLTHQGRSSASGHYLAWIKKEDRWFKCDDDYVEPVEPDDILKLSGGGDWHCAYVCLYGPRYLELPDSES